MNKRQESSLSDSRSAQESDQQNSKVESSNSYEIEAKTKSKLIFSPNQKAFWDYFLAILSLYSVTVLPLIVAF